MPSFIEMEKKINISIGLLIFIIISTFAVTNFYITQNTMQERMDKRYNRQQKDIEELKSNIKDLQTNHIK